MIIKDNKKSKVAHFFKDSEFLETSFLKSYFENKMGVGYVDSLFNPKSAQICIGNFSFYAGQPNATIVKKLKSNAKHKGLVIVAPDDGWQELFEKEYGSNNLYPHYRQAFVRKNIIFDITKLKYYANTLPNGYRVKPIDEQLYNLVLQEKWSEDFCINFDSYNDFKDNGIGYLLLHKDMQGNYEIVAGASSYIYYEGGIEIQISTKKDYRGKGLATCVGAVLILGCIENDINPTWDAANKISSKLATKFGFVSDNFYKALTLKLD